MQEWRNFIVNALELRLSCTNPSICSTHQKFPHISQCLGHTYVKLPVTNWLFAKFPSKFYISYQEKCSQASKILWTWCHQMETFSVLLALCEGNPLVTGEFPSQRPVTRSFDVFFDLCLNNRDTADLRCHHAYYAVTVMWIESCSSTSCIYMWAPPSLIPHLDSWTNKKLYWHGMIVQ